MDSSHELSRVSGLNRPKRYGELCTAGENDTIEGIVVMSYLTKAARLIGKQSEYAIPGSNLLHIPMMIPFKSTVGHTSCAIDT